MNSYQVTKQVLSFLLWYRKIYNKIIHTTLSYVVNANNCQDLKLWWIILKIIHSLISSEFVQRVHEIFAKKLSRFTMIFANEKNHDSLRYYISFSFNQSIVHSF